MKGTIRFRRFGAPFRKEAPTHRRQAEALRLVSQGPETPIESGSQGVV